MFAVQLEEDTLQTVRTVSGRWACIWAVEVSPFAEVFSSRHEPHLRRFKPTNTSRLNICDLHLKLFTSCTRRKGEIYTLR